MKGINEKMIRELKDWKSEEDLGLYSTLGESNFIGNKKIPIIDEDANSAEYFINKGMGLNGSYQ